MWRSVFLGFLLFPLLSEGALELPQGLDETDREQVVRLLGGGTSTKILSTPYPLGGFTGVELSYSVEFINTESLAELGTQGSSSDAVSYSKLSLAKGIYNNVDLFLEFMPYGMAHEFSSYGAGLRWTFYKPEEIPISITSFLHGNSSNFANELVTQSFGLDLLIAAHSNDFSVYIGGGRVQLGGRFMGGNQSLTLSGETEKSFLVATHSFVGLSYRIAQAFIAVQTDWYAQAIVSTKFGLRF